MLIVSLSSLQYQSTRAPSTEWTDTAPALHNSYLLQRDDWQHWVPWPIPVAHTLSTLHPMIHSSHDTSHVSLLFCNIRHDARIWPGSPSLPLNTVSALLTHFCPPTLSLSSCTPVTSQSYTSLSSITVPRHTTPNYPILKLHNPQ